MQQFTVVFYAAMAFFLFLRLPSRAVLISDPCQGFLFKLESLYE